MWIMTTNYKILVGDPYVVVINQEDVVEDLEASEVRVCTLIKGWWMSPCNHKNLSWCG